MTLASDQNIEPGKLSPNSQKMLALRDKVFSEWEARVRGSVEKASDLPHPILIDTLPALYDNLAEALTASYPRPSAEVASTTVAGEHGSERARLTDYDLRAVISEYQLLRQTIHDVLKQEGVPLSDGEADLIDTAIDATVKEAVTGFVLTQAAFRERFVATLAHDLRNPLATASMAAQLITKTTDPKKVAALAQQIVDHLGRMDRMIQDLLDSIVFQSGRRLHIEFSNFDLREVMCEVCEQATAVHGRRFELLGPSVDGWWGRDALKRALENLVDNAVKYGRAETPIRLKLSPYSGRVLLTVHNEGDPIPVEQLESIFQVFGRATAAKNGAPRGWGIGLPYVRSVAESHGGSIGIDSSLDRGSTFTIDIPVDARPFHDARTLG